MTAQRSTGTVTIPAAPDRDEIVRVIQLYIDGISQGDVSKLRECFHEHAWCAYTNEDGSLEQFPVADALPEWITYGGQVYRILSVTQAGDVASVILVMHGEAAPEADWWVDFHNLLRIDGVWKDMNKTATHAARAGWAGAQRP